MGTAINLAARDFKDGIPIFGKKQALEFTAALGIATFTDQQGRGLLTHVK